MKIRPVEDELFHAEGRAGGRVGGRTDKFDKPYSRFSQFC